MHTAAELKRELVRRMNAKDLPGTMELIADDAVYFWSNGAALFGKPAITEAMRSNFDGIQNDTYETLDMTWLVDTPEVAVCVFRFRWKGEIGGAPWPAADAVRRCSSVSMAHGARCMRTSVRARGNRDRPNDSEAVVMGGTREEGLTDEHSS